MKKEIEHKCPDCGAKVGFDLDDVAKERTVHCRNGHPIKLRDDNRGAAKVTKALKNLEKKIKRLGK